MGKQTASALDGDGVSSSDGHVVEELAVDFDPRASSRASYRLRKAKRGLPLSKPFLYPIS